MDGLIVCLNTDISGQTWKPIGVRVPAGALKVLLAELSITEAAKVNDVINKLCPETFRGPTRKQKAYLQGTLVKMDKLTRNEGVIMASIRDGQLELGWKYDDDIDDEEAHSSEGVQIVDYFLAGKLTRMAMTMLVNRVHSYLIVMRSLCFTAIMRKEIESLATGTSLDAEGINTEAFEVAIRQRYAAEKTSKFVASYTFAMALMLRTLINRDGYKHSFDEVKKMITTNDNDLNIVQYGEAFFVSTPIMANIPILAYNNEGEVETASIPLSVILFLIDWYNGYCDNEECRRMLQTLVTMNESTIESHVYMCTIKKLSLIKDCFRRMVTISRDTFETVVMCVTDDDEEETNSDDDSEESQFGVEEVEVELLTVDGFRSTNAITATETAAAVDDRVLEQPAVDIPTVESPVKSMNPFF